MIGRRALTQGLRESRVPSSQRYRLREAPPTHVTFESRAGDQINAAARQVGEFLLQRQESEQIDRLVELHQHIQIALRGRLVTHHRAE